MVPVPTFCVRHAPEDQYRRTHWYAREVTEPSSASEAVAAQVIAVFERTPELGVRVTVSTVGFVFKTVPSTLSSSLPPSPSVAVAVHVMVSPGLTKVLSSVNEAAEPMVLVPLVHAYVSVGVPPSGSLATAVQTMVLSVKILLVSMDTEVMFGPVFSTVTVSSDVTLVPSASVAVATHLMMSSGCASVVVRVRICLSPMEVVPLNHS